jgi:hypothetical protein
MGIFIKMPGQRPDEDACIPWRMRRIWWPKTILPPNPTWADADKTHTVKS